MDTLVTTEKNVPSTSMEMKNALKIAVVSSALLLTGTLATGIGNLIASSQMARIGEKTSCIARLDKQEDLLRSKGEAFATALASLSAFSRYGNGDTQAKAERLEAVSKTGFAMGVHAPLNLKTASGVLVNAIFDLVANTPSEPKKGSQEEYKARFDQWNSLFQQAIDDIDFKRERC